MVSINELENRIDEPLICNLEFHQEGKWVVGGARYMPSWPRGSSSDFELTRKIVESGLKQGLESYSKTNKVPELIRIVYHKGQTLVAVYDIYPAYKIIVSNA